jgi:divalent metal cation (Fe/Co/Zn/Cd) transporter
MVQKNIFNRTISNPLVQTFLIYISGGWIVLEMTDYFINNYGLSEKFRDVLLIIMLAGLPVALIISWYLSREKKEKAEDLDIAPDKISLNFFSILLKRPWFSIPGTIIMILIVLSLIRLIYRHSSDLTDGVDQIHSEISLAVLPFTNFTGNPE